MTQAFMLAVGLLKTADQVGQLVQKLQDHGRTLDQAEADRRKASDALDGPATPGE